MSGADDGKGASVLLAADWEATVGAAIQIHECIYRRLEALQSTAGGTDRKDAKWAMKGKVPGAGHALSLRTV